MSSTKKTPQHSVPIFNSPEADVGVAVAGAEGAVAGGAAVAGVEVALAAEAVWRALDVPQPGWGVAPPPPTYFYPPPGRPPLTRLRPVHKDEGPVEIPPVSKDPAPNATSTTPAPLHAAPATPAPATTPARPPSPQAPRRDRSRTNRHRAAAAPSVSQRRPSFLRHRTAHVELKGGVVSFRDFWGDIYAQHTLLSPWRLGLRLLVLRALAPFRSTGRRRESGGDLCIAPPADQAEEMAAGAHEMLP
jgi:hypothetical protein